MRDFRLYVILDVDIASACCDILEITRKIIAAGADILQLRAKSYSDRRILEIGRDIKNLVRKSKTAFVLNDRADLARLINADGLHLGQEDLPIQQARKILGSNKFIGLSTHNIKQAIEAQRENADYIAIGPIFPTAIKSEATALGPGIIAKLKDKIKIPLVAIGGINLDNLKQVLSCGAQRVAVCRAILEAKDVSFATRQFRQRLYR